MSLAGLALGLIVVVAGASCVTVGRDAAASASTLMAGWETHFKLEWAVEPERARRPWLHRQPARAARGARPDPRASPRRLRCRRRQPHRLDPRRRVRARAGVLRGPPPPGRRPLRGECLGLYLPRERRARAAVATDRPHWPRRGSSASRRPSPSRLNPSTASMIAAPGKKKAHHAPLVKYL